MEKETEAIKKSKVKKPAARKNVKPKEGDIKNAAVLPMEDSLPEKPATDGGFSLDIAVEDEKNKKDKRYFEAVGRRKTAVARVRLFTIKPFEEDEGKITVNNRFYKQYFPVMELQQIAEASLRRLKSLNRFEVAAKIKGGGLRAQAEALRHGLARTLILFNLDFRKKLKKAGFLKRDPRAKERKKFGLKKARRAPQWAKR